MKKLVITELFSTAYDSLQSLPVGTIRRPLTQHEVDLYHMTLAQHKKDPRYGQPIIHQPRNRTGWVT